MLDISQALPETQRARDIGEVRTVSSTGAAKGVKPEAFDLVPSGPVKLLAEFYGATGLSINDTRDDAALFNYAQGQLLDFWQGRDTDERSGSLLLIAAAAALAELVERGTQFGEPVAACAPVRFREEVPNPDAPRYDLIPPAALFALARHYGAGAAKYAAHNWAAGYEWSKPFAALQRHLWTARSGEHIDAETGSPHLVAALWHCLTMAEFYTTHPEFDDRPIRGTSTTKMQERANEQAQ